MSASRHIRQNVYGNIKAYVGRNVMWDFGCDAVSAREWLENGEWLVNGHAGDCLRSITANFKSLDRPTPPGYKWVSTHPENHTKTL